MHDINAENLFRLNSNFKTSNSTISTARQIATASGNTGSVILSKSIEDKITYTQTAKYCGTNLKTDLGHFATNFGRALPAITEADYWKGSQITIAGEGGEGRGVYTFSSMYSGKPIFEKLTPYNQIYFYEDRWYLFSTTPNPDTVIYQQTAANDWPWEGTWEVVAGSGATDEPDTPSAYLATDGTAYWTGMKVDVSGAGTTTVNGPPSFIGWIYGKPRFGLIDGAYVQVDSTGKWHIYTIAEFLYSATTVTDWPWEATYEAVGTGVAPAPTVDAMVIVPTSISINFTAVDYPEVTITGHDHATKKHSTGINNSDIAGIFPASGFGVPSFGVTTGDAAQISASLAVNIDHFDFPDADGTHLHGDNTKNVKGNLSISFIGIPTSQTEVAIETDVKAYFTANGTTVSHFLVESFDENTSNSDFESFSFNSQLFA